MNACVPKFEISEDKMTLEETEWCVFVLKAVKRDNLCSMCYPVVYFYSCELSLKTANKLED